MKNLPAPWLLLVLFCLTNCTFLQIEPDQPPIGWCAGRRCDRHPTTFAPAPGLEAFTEAALVRIREATGRDDLAIAPDGVPIRFSSDPLFVEVRDDSGKIVTVRACASTLIQGWDKEHADRTQNILLDPSNDACPEWETQLVHEITHALNPMADHSDSGVFKSHIDEDVIDEASLLKLCSDFRCIGMQAED